MALQLRSAPSFEPISLDETKQFLRLDTGDEDVLISSLITAARIYIETGLSHILLNEAWSSFLETWPTDGITAFGLTPVQSVEEVRVYSAPETFEVIDPAAYHLDLVSSVPKLNLDNIPPPASTEEQPFHVIELRFIAGYGPGPDDVPADLRHAVKLLVEHWYERREPIAVATNFIEVPETVSGIMAKYRNPRLS